MPAMITGARAFIDAPPVTPLGGGVMSVANVVNTDGHELMGAQFESNACADVEEWEEWCTVAPTGRKLFDDARAYVEGDPFALYAGVACDLQQVDDAMQRAVDRLDLAESRGVDRKVRELLEVEAVDLGGPFPVNQAIGVAEAYAATVYGGVPMLLIPRLFVPCTCGNGAVRVDNGRLMSCQGSQVANVTTPITEPVTAETETIYVTGQITLLRSSATSISVPQQTRLDGTFAPARALAERIYVPLFECLVAKVEASCS